MRMTYEYIRVVYGYTYIYIHIYFSLFKVDKNYNSLITNKHQLKNFFEKKGKKNSQTYKLYIPYIGDKSFT